MLIWSTIAVAVQFTQQVFSVYENESELVITLDVSRPALIEFFVIILASPDTAGGKFMTRTSKTNHVCTIYTYLDIL